MINFSNEEKEKLFSKEGFEEEAAELASKMNAQDKIDGNIESGIKTEEFELPDEGESEEWDEGAEVKQDIKNDSEEDDDDLDYEEDGDDEDYEDDFDEEDEELFDDDDLIEEGYEEDFDFDEEEEEDDEEEEFGKYN